MNHNHPIAVFILVITASAFAAEKSRPNILFFLADDQRSDMLSCAGHEILKTPNVDRLAKQGVRFENMFVTTSICAASRATLLTGLYERSHRFTFGTPPISAEHSAESYPAVLKAAGYRTGFIGKFGVSTAAGSREKMFDFFRPLGRSPYFHKQKDGTLRHETDLAADHAIEFLRQESDASFCLSISFNAPHAEDGDKENHYPWPPSADGMYDDIKIPPPKLSDPKVFESQPEFLQKSMNRDRYFWRWDTPEKYQKNIRAYYRMISGVDHSIGRVLAELKEQDLAESTVVIYAADNGYYAASRGFAGKWSHYEESLRVPLVIHDPRLPQAAAGTVRSETVLNVDIAPTILAAAGVMPPDGYQGVNLLPLSHGAVMKTWRSDFFCEHLFANRSIPKWEGVRGTRYKYARYFEQEPPFEFLHDLKEDPDELINLAGDKEHAETLAKMRARAIQLRDQYGGEYSREKFPSRTR